MIFLAIREEFNMTTNYEYTYERMSRAEVSNYLQSVQIEVGTPVLIYRNLHDKVFSVCVRSDGAWKVAHHTLDFVISDAKFTVQKGGQQRVRDGKGKNVHAFVQGIWQEDIPSGRSWEHVRYNPVDTDWWTNQTNNQRVVNASWVCGRTDGWGEQRVFVRRGG